MSRFAFAPIFQDYMVLQRNKRIRIFGTGENGEKVIVSLGEDSSTTVISDGKWMVELQAQNHRNPVIIKAVSNELELNIYHVVFGEVYIAGGQSNMQFMLKETFEYEEALKSIHKMDFRFYATPRIAYEGEDKSMELSGWHRSCDKSFDMFSAVSYFFGLKLQEYVDCPIGIISCNWGGSSLFNWISEEEGLSILSTSSHLQKIIHEVNNKSKIQYDNEEKKYKEKLKLYDKQVNELKREDKTLTEEYPLDYFHKTKSIDYPWPPPLGFRSFLRPGGLYKHMVKRLAPISVAGVLWYQGESDMECGASYRDMLMKLFTSWRNLFEDEELFFLVVQLPMFLSEECDSLNRVAIRQAQFDVSQEDRFAAMACILDLGDRDNIHPLFKKEVGSRLGILAGKYIYGKEEDAEGPILHKVEKTSSGYSLYFHHAHKGIYARQGIVLGFQVVEESCIYDVRAMIVGHHIEIASSEIRHFEEIKSIRYAYESFMLTSMYNWKQLPMYPFSVEV